MNKIGTQEIKTERLILRKLCIDDAEVLHQLGCLNGPLEEVTKNIEASINQYNNPLVFHWVIEYNKIPVGRIMAWEVSDYNEYCQLGYDVAKDYRCKGIMSEALKAVIMYLIEQVGANRVYCSVRTNNIGSNKCCIKAGMTLDGTLRKHYKSDNGFDNVNVYSFIKDDIK